MDLSIRRAIESIDATSPGGFFEIRDGVYEFLSKKIVLGTLTIVPVLLLYTLISVLPILWAFYSSFFEIGVVSLDWSYVGFDNYSVLIAESGFHASLATGVVFAAGSVVVQVVFGVAVALLIDKNLKYKRWIRSVALVPYLIPTVIVGFIILWMSHHSYGIVNQVLVMAGVIENGIPWFSTRTWAMPALIISNSWKFSIFVTILVLARLQSIPEGYYEAATVAGASWYQKFRDITLPNLKNVLFIVILLRGVWMFNKFDIIWVLTRGGPRDATTTAPIYAYEEAFVRQNLGEAAAISVVLFLMLVVAAIVYFVVLQPSEEVRVE